MGEKIVNYHKEWKVNNPSGNLRQTVYKMQDLPIDYLIQTINDFETETNIQIHFGISFFAVSSIETWIPVFKYWLEIKIESERLKKLEMI